MARSARQVQEAAHMTDRAARIIWPGLRIMLLPLVPLLFVLGCVFVVATLGSLYMGEGFHEIGVSGASTGTTLDAWIFGSLAAGCFWLRRVLWRGRLTR